MTALYLLSWKCNIAWLWKVVRSTVTVPLCRWWCPGQGGCTQSAGQTKSPTILERGLSPSLEINPSFFKQEHHDTCKGWRSEVVLNLLLVLTWDFQSGSLSDCLRPVVSHIQQSCCTVIHPRVCFWQRADSQLLVLQCVFLCAFQRKLVVRVFPEHIPGDLKWACLWTAGYVDEAGDRDGQLLFLSYQLCWLFDIYLTCADCRNSEYVMLKKKKTTADISYSYKPRKNVTLDHKTSPKSQFSEIEIYTSSESWINKLSINVRAILGRDATILTSEIWGCKKKSKYW